MSNLINDPSEKHFRYLDSARGIAATMVFVMHFFDHKYNGTIISSYWSIIFNGRDAVSFFFVLSGFVLSYKYIVLKKPLDLKKFYTSRFFRLWPAFFITLIITCLYAFYHTSHINRYLLKDLFIFNIYGFWEEAFMIRGRHFFYFPGWTLTIEMVASFLIPFFILIALKDKKLIPWLIAVFFIGVGDNWLYSINFLLGILISCYYSQINELSFRRQKWFRYRYLILFIAIAIWPIRSYDEIFHFGSRYKYWAAFFGLDFFHYTAVSSAIFIVTILYCRPIQKLLETKLLVFIGKLSYSLYLVHLLAINIIYDIVEKSIPSSNPHIIVASMIVSYIVLIFSLAALMHYFVELPLIRIGKKVVNKMRPSLVIVNANPVN